MKTGTENIVSKTGLSHDLETLAQSEINQVVDEYDFKSTFHASEISDCPRKLLYRATTTCPRVSEEDLHNRSAIEKWATLFEYHTKDKNVFLYDCNYNLVGNADIILELDYSNIILKVRAISDKDFEHVLSKGAFKKDVFELMVNEWLAEVPDGVIIYENRNDFRFEMFQVHLFAHIIEPIKTKCRDLIKMKMNGEMPERPYKTDNGKECSSCHHKTECWANKQ